MAEKKNRYQKNEKSADNRGKKQTEQKADHRPNNHPSKNQKNKPMTAAAAASHKAAMQAENAPKTTKKSNRPQQKGGKKKAPPALPVRYTVLGGLNEIGKNMAVLEYGDDAIIIDCGMCFPDEDLLGVDVVLPDFSYVLKIQKLIITRQTITAEHYTAKTLLLS